MHLHNATVILTGSGSGIGSALAVQLAAEGARVFGFDLRSADPHPGITPITTDITDPASVTRALTHIDTPVDLLINNAGIMRRGTLFDNTPEEFDLLMNVHVKGSWLMLKQALPRCAPNATVVQMLSRHALLPPADPALYALAKITADRMLDFVAMSHPALRIVRLYPGPTDTPLARTGVAATMLHEKEQRMITPNDLAEHIMRTLREDHTRLTYVEETGEYRWK